VKNLAIELSRVCNDLRVLATGGHWGPAEIQLPQKEAAHASGAAVTAPVPEVVNMVCFRVIGTDLTVTLAAEAGEIQVNTFVPVIAACILEAQTTLTNAARTLDVHCVEGITANPEVARPDVDVDQGVGTMTALEPAAGDERATELAAEVMRTGREIEALLQGKPVGPAAPVRRPRGRRSSGRE
jgi:aspartate ammonia-lyase